jgi:hypothetical protein
MHLQPLKLVLLTLAGTLLAGSALAGEAAVTGKSDIAAAAERSRASDAAPTRSKAAASPELARPGGKVDVVDKKRPLEVPVSVLPPPR